MMESQVGKPRYEEDGRLSRQSHPISDLQAQVKR